MADDVQVRSEETGIQMFATVGLAMLYAEEDKTVWKISFDYKGERVRLIRKDAGWVYEPLIPYLVKPGYIDLI